MEDSLETKYIQFRRELHANPELSKKEFETQKRILDRLREMDKERNLEIKTYETGVVVDLKGKGKAENKITIALRADTDGLPIVEETNVSYESKNKGVMHACGHDGHTAMLLMTVETVLRQIEALPSTATIRFMFQPAEELLYGAKMLIENGVMEGVDWVFGIHNGQLHDVGFVDCTTGPMLAKGMSVDAWITGKKGVDTAKSKTISPILIGAKAIKSINQMMKTEINPKEKLALGFGRFESGKANCLIPEKSRISFTIRVFSEEIAKQVKERVTEIFSSTAALFGGKAEVNVKEGIVTSNDEDAFNVVKKACEGVATLTQEDLPAFASEDFGYYTSICKGAFFFLEGRDKDHFEIPHTNKFNFNDKTLNLGVKVYLNILNDLSSSELKYIK